MKIKILKGKMWEMKKLAKNKECWQFSQSWDTRNTSSILPIQDKKRNTSSLYLFPNHLSDLLFYKEKLSINPLDSPKNPGKIKK
jgi:predicted double-glycine peptidase